jgi:hypothetical protein
MKRMQNWIMISVCCLSLLFFDCSTPSSNPDFPPEYHVQCTIGGTTYNFSKGATNGETVAHIVGDWMYFHATTDNLTQNQLDNLDGHCIAIEWSNGLAGQTGTFSGANAFIDYVDPIKTDFQSTSATITILKYDDVGGNVEGTFSGVVQELGGLAVKNVTNGTFRIKRIAQ